MAEIKKVMFHINSLGKGGAERVVTVLTREMLRRGLEVTIVTEWFDKKAEYPLPEGAKRIDAGLNEEEEKKSRTAQIRLREAKLHDAILSEKPDVLFAFCRNANYRAILAARGTGVPVIISVRNDPKVYYASGFQKMLSGRLYPMAAGTVFQTEEARDFFKGSVKKKGTVIMNPVSEEYLKAEPAAKRRKAIVNSARFAYAKDHMTLIKAFEKVLLKYPDYTLELYGDKSDDNEIFQIKEWVRFHKLEDKILFMGNQPDLEKKIIDASVFVLSSVYEGMPNALMEAMAMGIPCVSSDCPCGGPAALIRDGENGLLFKTGDERELTAAICRMLERPEDAERTGRQAREDLKKCTPEKICDRWLEYAARMTGKNSR